MEGRLAEEGLERAHALEIADVRKTYRLGGDSIPVLRGITFDVAEGELLAIQGSSGAGKSTLLHLIGLLDRPDQGSIRLFGREVSRASESERSATRATDLAFVFQFYFLLPEFTALENVVMAGLIAKGRGRAGKSKEEVTERAKDLLSKVGLARRLAHRPKELSGGERQRVAIARALVNLPRLVLCDEPTGNLDSATAAGIHELLLGLNAEFRQTMIVVTHEESMARIAPRRLVMQDGVIASEDRAGRP